MGLADFLWACPECGADRGLRTGPSPDRCGVCGTRYVRDRGAQIRATAADGTVTTRAPADWIDRLPDAASLVEDAGDGVVRAARVSIRTVTGDAPVHGESGFLNRVEVFGEPAPGHLEAYRDQLRVEWEGEGAEVWPLDTLTAVQASSSALQVKRRNRPLVALRFLDDSVYLWEQLVRALLRDFYGRTGKGVIREFQPRIVTDRDRP